MTLPRISLRGDELELPEIDLSEGTRFFVLQAIPRKPIVLWHSSSVWHAELQEGHEEYDLVLTGVPNMPLEVDVWCGPKGAPPVTSGGTLKKYNKKSKLAIVSTEADRNAEAQVRIKW